MNRNITFNVSVDGSERCSGPSGRRPAGHPRSWLALSILLIAATGCRGGSDAGRDFDRWQEATSAMLVAGSVQTVAVDDGPASTSGGDSTVPPTADQTAGAAVGTRLVLPPGNEFDAYVASLATYGLSSTDLVDPADLMRSLDDELADGALDRSIAGPVYLAREYERAIGMLGELDDDRRSTIVEVLEATTQTPADPSRDPFEVMYALELAKAVDYDVERVEAWVVDFVRTASADPARCSGDIYGAGALAEAAPSAFACDAPSLRDEISEVALEVTALERWDLGSCEAFLAITRLAPVVGSPADTNVVAAASDAAQRHLAGGTVDDPVACSAVVREGLSNAGLEDPPLAPDLAGYLATVAMAGGEAVIVDLDAGSTALAARLMDEIGNGSVQESFVRTIESSRRDATGVDRVELDLALDEEPDRVALVETIGQAQADQLTGERDVRAAGVGLRALIALDDQACGVEGASTFLSDVVERWMADPTAPGRLSIIGQALRVGERCGWSFADERVRSMLVEQAAAVITPTAEDGPAPDLFALWDAVAATCAADPDVVPDGVALWDRYRSTILETGGAIDPEVGNVSLERTFILSTLGLVTADRCEASGVLG